MCKDNDDRKNPVDWAMLLAGTFEAELLLELMLCYWKHPLAADREFRNNLLESAAEVLLASSNGEVLIEEMRPMHMNFIAAVWFLEETGQHEEHSDARRAWAATVKQSIPSCFCSQDDLF